MRIRPFRPIAALLLAALAVPVLAGDAADSTVPEPRPAAVQEKERKAEDAAAALARLRPAPRSLDEAMRRLAATRVNVEFKDTAFADAVDFVRRVSGMNVMIAPALQAKGVEGIRAITLKLADVPLSTLCDLLCKFGSTKLKFEDGILQFTTPEDARGRPVLRIYSIADVTMRLRNFPGPDINLHPSGAEFEKEEESDVENAWSDPQKIVDLIQKTIAESTWTDEGVSISADEGKLIVKTYAEVHAQIARLLAVLRAAR